MAEQQSDRESGPDTTIGEPTERQMVRCRVIALAPTIWDNQWMNRQQILSRLARHHDILYSNGPWSVWDRERERFKASRWAGSFERRDGVLVDRPPKLLLGWPKVGMAERLVERLAVARWRRELDRMGTGPLIVYVFYPSYLRFAQLLHADLLVYSPFDLFSRTPSWTPQDAETEHRLLGLCDLVITSSEATRAALQPQTTKPVFCVPNGADADFFESGAKQPPPDDLAAIPHPRIGYIGSLNRKVDFRLIANLARAEPGWQFVLMGPMGDFDDESRDALSDCRRLPNVHVLPSRPLADLPKCMGSLDVALMCYRQNTWMDFAFPLKLYEYLAVGLPVVSSPLPSILDRQEYLEIADDADSWRAAIARALDGHGRSTPDARRAEARRNTWDTRVATIETLLSSALHGTLPAPPSTLSTVNAW